MGILTRHSGFAARVSPQKAYHVVEGNEAGASLNVSAVENTENVDTPASLNVSAVENTEATKLPDLAPEDDTVPVLGSTAKETQQPTELQRAANYLVKKWKKETRGECYCDD